MSARRQAGSLSLLWDVSGYERRRHCPPVMNAGSLLPNVVMCFSARSVPVRLSLSLSLSLHVVCMLLWHNKNLLIIYDKDNYNYVIGNLANIINI
jgi:hypothetical protein